MIYGVGTDICKLSRIESMKSLDAFAKKSYPRTKKRYFLVKMKHKKLNFLDCNLQLKRLL